MKESIEFGLLALWLAITFLIVFVVSQRVGAGAKSGVIAFVVVTAFFLGSILHPTTAFIAADAIVESGLHGVMAAGASAVSGTPLYTLVPGAAVQCSAGIRVASTGAQGSLDSIGISQGNSVTAMSPGAFVKLTDTLVFSGWLVDDSATRLADAPCLIVDGKVAQTLSTVYHAARPDVSAALKNDALGASGFEFRIRAAEIGRGSHAFGVGALQPATKTSSALPRLVNVTIR